MFSVQKDVLKTASNILSKYFLNWLLDLVTYFLNISRCIALNGTSVIMLYDWGDGNADGPFEAVYHREMMMSDFIGKE